MIILFCFIIYIYIILKMACKKKKAIPSTVQFNNLAAGMQKNERK